MFVFFAIRFDRLISRNVSVQIESEVNLKPREECLYWLDRVLSSNVLGSIFVVNQVFRSYFATVTVVSVGITVINTFAR